MSKPLPQQKKPRLVGSVHMDHPGAVAREHGERTRVFLSVDRRLKGGSLDEVDLTEDDLLELIEGAAKALRVLRARESS